MVGTLVGATVPPGTGADVGGAAACVQAAAAAAPAMLSAAIKTDRRFIGDIDPSQ